MKREGKTILFVTHDLQALTQFCDRAILLDGGKKIEDGSPEHVVQRYHGLIFERERKASGRGEHYIQMEEDDSLTVVRTIPYVHSRFGEKGAEILGIILHSDDGEVVSEVRSGEDLRLQVSVRYLTDIESPIVGVTVRDRLGTEITATNSSYEGLQLPPGKAGQVVTVGFRLQVPFLRPGSYSISPAVASGNVWEHSIEDWIDNAYIFSIMDTGLVYGMMKWSFEVGYRIFD